ncbi:MAG: hypothetical protein LUH17_00705 [Acidaminococcaceae bacterium]|nr:hypothetical protein [Acidaminococcaceae bacterium]
MYIACHGYISPIWSRELTLRFMAVADKEKWDLVVHDCSNDTKFARDLHLGAQEGKWLGASSYTAEFLEIPYAVFLPVLRDDDFHFLVEEELPAGYKPGEMLF